jgi:uncharacterized protein YfaS (alpha-2-macroglobulin family)
VRWYAGGDGNLYARDTYAADPFVAEGTVYTDANGRATIPFNTQWDVPDSTYTVSVTVRDAQRRQVEGSASVPVYAASLRVGLRTEALTVALGGLIPLQIRVADLDGKPAPARVTLIARHQVWNGRKNEYETKELARTTVSVPATGRATATLPAGAQGDITITATTTDPTGRTTSATTSVWVADPNYRPEREQPQPTVAVRLDRRVYRPGDTVRAFVTTNTPARPLLLTLEGGDLFEHVVVPKGRRAFSWNVRARLDLSPNAHVDVSQWARPAQLISASALVAVPDPSRRMNVTVEPGKAAYRPGDQPNTLSAPATTRTAPSRPKWPSPWWTRRFSLCAPT